MNLTWLVRHRGRGDGARNALELAVRAQLAGELPVEPDGGRWFPLWSAPPLR